MTAFASAAEDTAHPRPVRETLSLIAAQDAERLVPELLAFAATDEGRGSDDLPAVLRALQDADARFRADLVHHLAARYLELQRGTALHRTVMELLHTLLYETEVDLRPPVTRAALIALVSEQEAFGDTDRLIRLTELELADGREPPADFVAVVRRSLLMVYGVEKELGPTAARLTSPVLNPGEAWSDRALADLPGLGEDWLGLLAHTLGATSARPSAKWEKTARALLDAVGAEAARERLLSWLRLVGGPRTRSLLGYFEENCEDSFDPYNANALRGLAWLLSLLPPHPATARALGSLVETALRRVPGRGPVNPKVANAGVVALARIDAEAALAELARLTTRVTYKATLKLLNTTLDDRAAALGISREEIEDLAVPAYGLTEVGRAERRLGDFTALLEVRGGKALLTWRGASGKTVRTVPAAVRRDHAEALKELKAAVKDVDRMLSAQSERLDRQFLAGRVQPYAAWRKRCLDHPLMGTLARRLLWTVDGTTVGHADGELRTLDDTPVTDGTEVALWHPVGRDPAEIEAWRGWLERHGITQPFKQAHREVYVLTDAERATGTYSNRFAAHVLRQHQFHALAAVRGWHNKLRLVFDDLAPPATRELPAWGLRAEVWIGGDGGENPAGTTDSGAYLHVRTDQVRFYPIDAPQNSAHMGGGEYRMRLRDGTAPVDPLPLTAVPALVLSEVLRDIDLFIGVTSVGNDPTWQDGGPDSRFREYWTSYGFGELGQSALTRRAVLERLVPRLAIADRCTLEDRFLRVRGDRHTYRIHLGSGNILRSPNDQYVCIVPRSAPEAPRTAVHLPFEGDGMLAVILSKAVLLAEDRKITDPTILSQL
ncbi:DUF4132 domain-containing protein [Streptomyces sp. NPDC096132]|uniref:DUF4132 domain-containing protein n=1 Tax=Streptomyces sp. NPDC096132 TaxID=3366075 RepID=UPI0037F10BEE